VGDADTFAYYLEAKYKLTPQLFGAIRWNQQFFGTVSEGANRVRWGREAWRLDLAAGYRLSAHMQLKLQYNFQRGDIDGRSAGHLAAAQFTVRF
jgi:predicted porin